MGRNTILVCLLVLVITGTTAAAKWSRNKKRSNQPNIVIVLADDMGIGDVGYNGDLAVAGAVNTPVLDELVAKSTKLTRFYTNALCTPSRVSLMTGRFASRTNMKNPEGYEYAQSLNGDEQLLPEIVKDLGYQTHMVGKWHLGQHERKFTPVGRGFDSYCGNLGGSVDYFHHNYAPPNTVPPAEYRPHDLHCAYKVDSDSSKDFSHDLAESDDHSTSVAATCDLLSGVNYNTDGVTRTHRIEVTFAQPSDESTNPDEATYGDSYITNIYGRKNVEVIKAHDPDNGPLFLYAAFTAGHVPLQALTEDFAACHRQVIPAPQRYIFCAMVKALDRNVGYIVDALKAKGMWEDTLFIFASDNGGFLNGGGDAGPLRGQKGQHYEGGIRTPAFIHFGENTVKRVSRTQGIEMNQSIHLVDLFNTIVGAASKGGRGYDFANEIDGRNLWKYLSQGQSIPSDEARINFNLAAGEGFLSVFTRTPHNEDGSFVEAVIATYGNTEYKLCRNCAGFEGDEIFDLFADPYETTNLLGDKEYAEPETFLKETLANWVAVSSPQLKYPTLVDRAAELLQEAGLDPDLAEDLVNNQRCYVPLDSPEFICSNCSRLALDFPATSPPYTYILELEA